MATSAWCENCGLHWSDCSCSRENRNAPAETDWTRRVREAGRRAMNSPTDEQLQAAVDRAIALGDAFVYSPELLAAWANGDPPTATERVDGINNTMED